jgi:hypothetical protein
MRFAGFAKSNFVDDLMTSEQLDQKRRHAWLEFKGAMDKAVVAANREVLGKLKLSRDQFLRLALNTASLRAAYLQQGVEIGSLRSPTREQLEELALMRHAYDEARQVFEALERIIERGYVEIPKG